MKVTGEGQMAQKNKQKDSEICNKLHDNKNHLENADTSTSVTFDL